MNISTSNFVAPTETKTGLLVLEKESHVINNQIHALLKLKIAR